MRKAILSSLLTAAVLFPATSHAETVTLTDVMGVTATFVSPLGSHNEALAGAVGVTHASALPVPTAFEAYCIDLLNPLFFAGDYDATLGPPMSLWDLHQPSQITDGGEAAWLFEEYRNEVGTLFESATLTDDQETDVARGALQLAIWNVLYDSDDTVDAVSDFYVTDAFIFDANDNEIDVTNDVRTLANQLLASINGVAEAHQLRLTFQDPDFPENPPKTAQSLIAPLADDVTPVPEPTSLLLLGTGVVALVGAHRRRAK